MEGCAFQVEGSSRLIWIHPENHQYEYSSFQIPLLATVSYFKTSICYTLSVLIFKLGIEWPMPLISWIHRKQPLPELKRLHFGYFFLSILFVHWQVSILIQATVSSYKSMQHVLWRARTPRDRMNVIARVCKYKYCTLLSDSIRTINCIPLMYVSALKRTGLLIRHSGVCDAFWFHHKHS